MTSWLIDVINILTGNLDRPGGVMFTGGGVPTPILFNECFAGDTPPIGRWHSRVRKLPETVGMLPTAALADEILTPGEGQVRGLITQAGNIALSNPNGGRDAPARRATPRSQERRSSGDSYAYRINRGAAPGER